jgi:hypothetical protein
MATSGSKNFDMNVAEYVEEAFERCGLQVRTGYDLQTARRSLNILFADWANRGINRWTISQETLTLAEGIAEYPLGTLTMTVASTTDFSAAETITGGTSSATASITSIPSATSIAITVPSGTFTSGETLTGGTSGATTTLSSAVDFINVQSSIDILSAVIRQDSGATGQSDLAMGRVSRDHFLNISSKRITSRPNQFYVDRQITPIIKVWPSPDSSTNYILVYDRLVRMDDADTMVNTMEVPFRFYPSLAAGLAYYLSLKKAPEKVEMLKILYEEEFTRAADEDRDKANLRLVPDGRYYTTI